MTKQKAKVFQAQTRSQERRQEAREKNSMAALISIL